MILKQIRLSKNISQAQLAEMSGLNVRTIQRIESGQNASVESKKCLAAALDITISQLDQEKVMIDKQSDNWEQLPLFLKIWFIFNFLQMKPARHTARRVELMSQWFGFIFCCLGFVSEAALAGGIIMLLNGHLFHLLTWQGDKYDIWYDQS